MLRGTKLAVILISTLITPFLYANQSEWQHDYSGVFDLRVSSTDSEVSYLRGGTGRYRYTDGESISLAQASIKYQASLDNWSINLIGTGYLDGENNGLGITEAFVRYRGTPDESGIRHQFRGGIIYPKISLENIATAWLSPYTMTFSTQNTWIGEEVRHMGLEYSLDLLGRFRDLDYDLHLTATAFQYNDPTGALLAWHGWTQSSRQTLWGEKLDFPDVPAMAPGRELEIQAKESDPFVELDDDFGFHLNLDWRWQRKLRLRLGYYDNQAADDVVINGQYTWRTKFSHLGLEWRLDKNTTIIAQHMEGDTRMRVANDRDVVGLDFTNGFILLTHKAGIHRYTIRYEQFNNEDFDGIVGDNNDDQGEAMTLGYQYHYGGGAFLMVEYNYIDSIRPAYWYQRLPRYRDESQFQVGVRYFF